MIIIKVMEKTKKIQIRHLAPNQKSNLFILSFKLIVEKIVVEI